MTLMDAGREEWERRRERAARLALAVLAVLDAALCVVVWRMGA